MKILYLYAEVMGYTMATIQALVTSGAEVHVVHWDHKKLSAYRHSELNGVHFYPRSKMAVEAITSLAKDLLPSITVVSGWMDKGYLIIARQLKRRGLSVVMGLDTQWRQSFRQSLLCLVGQLGYFDQYFSHAWVAGVYQYEYALKLGFQRQEILFDLYSADLNLFNQTYATSIESKKNLYPHRFLFVGRLEAIKGLDDLIAAWESLSAVRGDWQLHLIGDGSLKPMLLGKTGIVLKHFMQPDELINEIAKAGCFILPSHGEPWGVVLHEFSAAGLPLIVSDVVGASSAFLISGFNGFTFPANNGEALANKMLEIIEMTNAQLLQMGHRSHQAGQKITPETSAANLMSIVR